MMRPAQDGDHVPVGLRCISGSSRSMGIGNRKPVQAVLPLVRSDPPYA